MKVKIEGYEGLPAGEYAAEIHVDVDGWRMTVTPEIPVADAVYTLELLS